MRGDLSGPQRRTSCAGLRTLATPGASSPLREAAPAPGAALSEDPALPRPRRKTVLPLGGEVEAPVLGTPVSPRVSVRRSGGGSTQGAGCSGVHIGAGGRGGIRPGGCRHSPGAGAGAGSGALELPAGKAAACAALSGKKTQRPRSSPLPRPPRRAGPTPRPGAARSSPAPDEPFPRQRKVPGRAAPPGGRFRDRGGAVEECGDNAPSVTAGPRRGRERRRGR